MRYLTMFDLLNKANIRVDNNMYILLVAFVHVSEKHFFLYVYFLINNLFIYLLSETRMECFLGLC